MLTIVLLLSLPAQATNPGFDPIVTSVVEQLHARSAEIGGCLPPANQGGRAAFRVRRGKDGKTEVQAAPVLPPSALIFELMSPVDGSKKPTKLPELADLTDAGALDCIKAVLTRITVRSPPGASVAITVRAQRPPSLENVSTGQTWKPEVLAAMRPITDQILPCYRALPSPPPGKVIASFDVDKDGHPGNLTVTGGDSSLQECVRRPLVAATLPWPGVAPLHIEFPFVFTPPSPAASASPEAVTTPKRP
jgi:hypothetical protein